MRSPEQEGAGDVENLLNLLAWGRVPMEIVLDRLLFGKTGVNVLSVDANVTAEAPADFTRKRLEESTTPSGEKVVFPWPLSPTVIMPPARP